MASQHALRQTPSPPCGQTHTCKNITLATTSLRPVINYEPGQHLKLLRTIPFKVEALSGEVALFSHNQFMKREKKRFSPILYVILR